MKMETSETVLLVLDREKRMTREPNAWRDRWAIEYFARRLTSAKLKAEMVPLFVGKPIAQIRSALGDLIAIAKAMESVNGYDCKFRLPARTSSFCRRCGGPLKRRLPTLKAVCEGCALEAGKEIDHASTP